MIYIDANVSAESIKVRKTMEERLEEIFRNIDDNSKKEKTLNDIESLKWYISNYLSYSKLVKIHIPKKEDSRRTFFKPVNKFNEVDYDVKNDESIIQEETPDDFKDNRLLFKLIVINFLDSLKECLKSRKFSLDAKKYEYINSTFGTLLVILNKDNSLINAMNKDFVSNIDDRNKTVVITPEIFYMFNSEGEIVQADSDFLYDYLYEFFNRN